MRKYPYSLKCVIGIDYIQPSSPLALVGMILGACSDLGPSAVGTAIEKKIKGSFEVSLGLFSKMRYPGEHRSGGHMVITHQMLASTLRIFCVVSLPRTDRKW